MNSHNLIRLGAACQKMFDIEGDFEIINIPSDYRGRTYRVLIPFRGGIYDILDVEDVQLVTFGSTWNHEVVEVGYSERARTLLIKDGFP